MIILTLSYSLYYDEDDISASIYIENMIWADVRRPHNSIGVFYNTLSPCFPPDQTISNSGSLKTYLVAHNVSMRFKYNKNKFNGDLCECWLEYVYEYEQI